jgi:DNA repair exonuclease SbcCD ATPase subunit
MQTLLEDLIIDRVDLCDEGANSAAFIELYKRKETSRMDVQEILKQMTPEHAKVIQEAIDNLNSSLEVEKNKVTDLTSERDKLSTELTETKKSLDETEKALEEAKEEHKPHPDDCTCPECTAKREAAEKDKKSSGNASFDQTETFKSMPKEVQEYLSVIKQQKEAAEEELRKSREEAAEAEAIAKASELKALPVDKEKLASVIKSSNPEMIEMLETINGAIEGTVLNEVGKTASNNSSSANDAWEKIDKKAADLASSENITKAKAVSRVIEENPDLYREYLEGGAN